MYKTWFEHDGYRPPLRIDHYPLALAALGVGLLVFELTFWVGVFWAKTRVLYAVGGLIFHNAAGLFVDIPFWNLQLLYVSLFNWRCLSSGRPEVMSTRPGMALRAGAGLLLVGMFTAGLTARINAWPVAGYPPFASLIPRRAETIDVVAVAASGETRQFNLRERFGWMPAERYDDLLRTILRADPAEQNQALRALVVATGEIFPR